MMSLNFHREEPGYLERPMGIKLRDAVDGLRPVFTQCSQNTWIGDSKIFLMDEEDDNTCNDGSSVYSHGAARIP